MGVVAVKVPEPKLTLKSAHQIDRAEKSSNVWLVVSVSVIVSLI